MDLRSIRGRVAIVTGAASGMGLATAALFAREGARVVLTDLDQARCDACAEAIRAEGGEVLALALDIADASAIGRVVEEVARQLGGIDIIVNNAGIYGFESIDAGAAYDGMWGRCLDIMLTGQQRLIRAALPWLRRSDAPRVVNIASTEAFGATTGNSAYVAAKHGVIGLTRGFAVDLGPEGITVNCICPGAVNTGMTQGFADDRKETFARRRIALRRYAEPEEIAQMTLSLVLPAASYVTGAVLAVDGGLSIRNA
ncbi:MULTISPECIES: SDR family NAD(P)-dependent oxidoreductase [unclassified Haematobacter]|uniref:SDR family NAD(P)-dependent oxidoreductase n=1 Tax=unclassified Haematobacter TaxID=2640585 RepID=UPI0025C626B3|nr:MULTISPECIES: SDR family NAD(P)-dependent oxidoreductase [unclassified Haematobacter]